MKYYMPAKVYDEDNCVLNHSAEIAALGKKALIVTGAFSSRVNGSLEDVMNALDTHSIPWEIFDSVEENPSVETVMKARDFGIECGADFVIGIGGGSPLDAAKAIALMMAHPGSNGSYLFTGGLDSHALPIVLVPTTCGTGSEVTQYSVLTLHDKHTKGSAPHELFADLALIDYKYLHTAPHSVICSTAVDALSHLWESRLSTKTSDYSRMLTAGGLDIWKETIPVLRGDRPAESDDLRNLMRASTMAGLAIAHAGTSLPHGLSYTLTYDLGVAHGTAVGFFQAGYLSFAPAAERNYLLSAAGFNDLDQWLEFYNAACRHADFSEDILMRCVDDLYSKPAKLAAAPFSVDREVLTKIALYGA